MTINESATATDGFGVVSTPVTPEPAPIQPAEPTRRRPSGRVDFPGGVLLAAPGTEMRQTPINVEGFGWLTVGVAQQLAASLAGAVAEARRQAAQDKQVRG